MSSPYEAFDSSDFAMIHRVLENAGYRGSSADVDSEALSGAAIYLLNQFRQGKTSEEDLVALLDQRGRDPGTAGDTPAQVKAQALDRWQDEGGSAPDILAQPDLRIKH
jgi:hypothetical protein